MALIMHLFTILRRDVFMKNAFGFFFEAESCPFFFDVVV
jgi:hypothetical protein